MREKKNLILVFTGPDNEKFVLIASKLVKEYWKTDKQVCSLADPTKMEFALPKSIFWAVQYAFVNYNFGPIRLP